MVNTVFQITYNLLTPVIYLAVYMAVRDNPASPKLQQLSGRDIHKHTRFLVINPVIHTTDASSLGNTGVELAMSMDNGASDIRPFNVAKPAGTSGKPKIMKRSVIRVTVELEVLMETKQYLHFLQELPELFSLHEFSNLRCRVTWKQKRVSYQESPLPIEVKVVEDHKYQRWFVTFTVLMVLCFIGIITLFFSIPNLYKQDIHFLRNDTIHQEFSISNSRIDLKDVSLTNHGGKDTLVIKDKKIIIAK